MSAPLSGLLERVAEALYARNPFYEGGEHLDGFPVSPGGCLTWAQCCECQPAYAQAMREDARAAIEALRDSPDMRAAWDRITHRLAGDPAWVGGLISEAWDEMFAAALSEGGGDADPT